jgi:hypothetical protein
MAIIQDSSHPTGVTSTDNGGSSLARARARKASAALALRKNNESWEDIARELGYPTPRAALIAVEGALEAGLATPESQDFMRQMASEQLRRLLYPTMKKATDSDDPDQLTAVGKARELVMDHAKLNGYMAPAELSIYNPAAGEIEQFVAAILHDRQPSTLEEADIFELHEDEDGTWTTETEDAVPTE